MKKICFLLLIAVMSVALVACGGSGSGCANHNDADFDDVCDACGEVFIPACGGHFDEDSNFSCDKCGEPYAPICSEHKDTNNNLLCDRCGATVEATCSATFVTKDDEGVKISGLVLEIKNDYGDVYTAISNEEGMAVVTLAAGEYRVTYKEESIPEFYLCIPKTVFLSADGMTFELEIINNTPNGTAKRPFVITDDVNQLSVPAGETYYYVVSHAADRTLIVTGEGFKISYNEETYEVADGEIRIKLVETDPNEPSNFAVINESGADINVPVVLESPLGSHNNPIIIESLGEAVCVDVSADGYVYYKWIATFSGTLVVKSTTENKNIKVTNNANSIQAELSSESDSAVINVAEGDEISVVVSASADGTVEFTLSMENNAE